MHERHPNWIGGERRTKLDAGDYSIDGMQELLALEQKAMADVIHALYLLVAGDGRARAGAH